MTGVVNVFKLPGQTSRDVVDAVRRSTGIRKAGHSGTLDPAASGVLPVLLDRATRLQEYLAGLDKTYVAEMTFGLATESGDAYGEIIASTPGAQVSEEGLRAVIGGFLGEIQQVPPMTSALKRDGIPLYRLARSGVEVERDPRTVRVQGLDVIEWRPGDPPRALISVTCSAGTYVRTLVADLARAMGSSAFMSFLVRTSVGPFCARDALVLGSGEPIRVVPASEALGFLPSRVLSAEGLLDVAHGRIPRVYPEPPDGSLRLLDAEGDLVAVAEVSAGDIRLSRVLIRPEEIEGDRG